MSIFVHKTYVWSPPLNLLLIQKDLFEFFHPPTHKSLDFKNWIVQLDLKTCLVCRNNDGKTYEINEILDEEPPIHERCRCKIKNMKAAFVGTATQDGMNGADVAVKTTGNLPLNYISKQEAINLGWIS